jgi:hypothetical protein
MKGLDKKFLVMVVLNLLWLNAIADVRSEYVTALKNWEIVLADYVDEKGRINFRELANNNNLIQRYVNAVNDYGPTTDPKTFVTRDSILAFHINTYNALAMHGVIDKGIPKNFSSMLKRAKFFSLRLVKIDGEITTLNNYENNVIRKLKEPRVHFALNCMVRDCPRLPRTVFLPERIEIQLEKASHEFMNSEKNIRVDRVMQTIWVSEIFDFYTNDFVVSGKKSDLVDYINQYREKTLPKNYAIKFLKYDWTINQQP